MTGSRSWVNNGIETQERGAVVTWHAPEGRGGAGQQRHGGGKGRSRLHGGLAASMYAEAVLELILQSYRVCIGEIWFSVGSDVRSIE